jgi:hypothetical protein
VHAKHYILILGAVAVSGAVADLVRATLHKNERADLAPIITIGNEQLTEGDFERWTDLRPIVREQLQKPQGRRIAATELVRMEALAQDARRRRLDQNPVVHDELRFQMDEVLANAEMRDVVRRSEPSEQDIHKYFAEHLRDFERVDVRQILISFHGCMTPPKEGQPEIDMDEAFHKATHLRNQILAGRDFDEIAKKESDDTMTRQSGGEPGNLRRIEINPVIAGVAFTLHDGEVSSPVRSIYGYHIVQTRTHSTATLKEVHEQIASFLRKRRSKEITQALIAATPVRLDEAFFNKQ